MNGCRTLRHTTLFDASLLAFGSIMEADEAISRLLVTVAAAGHSFPVVQVPELRIATEEKGGFAVFFRLVGADEVELLRAAVLEVSRSIAA